MYFIPVPRTKLDLYCYTTCTHDQLQKCSHRRGRWTGGNAIATMMVHSNHCPPSLVPRPHPLTRKRVWWPLSDFLVVPSQQNAISHVTWVVQQRQGWGDYVHLYNFHSSPNFIPITAHLIYSHQHSPRMKMRRMSTTVRTTWVTSTVTMMIACMGMTRTMTLMTQTCFPSSYNIDT